MKLRLLAILALGACVGASGKGTDDTSVGMDADGDGVPSAEDCDDNDPKAGAARPFYTDADSDGVGAGVVVTLACDTPTGLASSPDDCDDNDVQVHPGAEETCDAADNNCDGAADEGLGEAAYTDGDRDGYGAGQAVTRCDAGLGYSSNADDCDDLNDTVSPGAPELCDGADNNCDGDVDGDAVDSQLYYPDADGDNFGSGTYLEACNAPVGYSDRGDDCQDGDPRSYPGATERCDSVDNDCDGAADEADAVDPTSWYTDADADGYGDESTANVGCFGPTGTVNAGGDCDDDDPSRSPAATELCDHIDNNCDGLTDDADPAVDTSTYSAWYVDRDTDGYGDATAVATFACAAADSATDSSDCDDTDLNVNPGATELCDAKDTDCDGVLDDSGLVSFEDTSGLRTDVPELLTGTGTSPVDYAVETPGILSICAGVWYVNLVVESDVVVSGPAGSAATELNGGGVGSVVRVETGASAVTATISGLTLTNGYADAGGGLYVEDSTVSMFDVVVLENVATLGGGIYAEDAVLSLNDVTLSDNGADDGGAAYVTDSFVSWTEVIADANVAARDGGALHLSAGADLMGLDCTFDHNRAEGRGGAIYAENAVLRLDDSSGYANQSAGDGGAIAVEDADLTLVEAYLSYNVAGGDGGAIGARDSVLEIELSTLEGNAAEQGGGICAIGVDGALVDTLHSFNVAALDGGGIHLSDSASLDITGSSGFTANTAGARGGGLFATDATLGAVDTSFSFNEAETSGGGLYIGSGTVSMSGVSLVGNAALTACTSSKSNAVGGGGLFLDDSYAELSGLSVMTNRAVCSGGGAFFAESEVLWETSLLMLNEATVHGGGAVVHSGTSVTLSEMEIALNTAGDEAAGILSYQADLFEILDSAVSDNDAADKAGGLAILGAGSVQRCTISGNTAVNDGGGLLVGNLNAVDRVEVVTTDFDANTPDPAFNDDANESYSFGLAASFICDDNGCF